MDAQTVPHATPNDLIAALRAGAQPDEIEARFAGRTFIGEVNLRGLTYSYPLLLRGCAFRDRVTMEDAHLDNTLDMSDCQFDKGLSLNTARIEGNLVLERCKFGVFGPSRIHPSGDDSLCLWQVHVLGSVQLAATEFAARLNLREGIIVGRLMLNSTKIEGDLDLANADIGADLFCSNLSKEQSRSEIGRVWMLGTKVGGQVDFSSTKIAGDLELQSAEIGGALFCRNLAKTKPCPEIGGQVRMFGTKVNGAVDFSGAKIASDLKLQNTQIGADFFCRSLKEEKLRPEIGGQVRMSGTKVSGGADFSGVTITKNLELQNVEIGANFDAASAENTVPRTKIGGTVLFTGTRVEGVTTFVGAEINGGFSGERAEFDDGLFLSSATATELREEWRGDRETAIAKGIDLSHARINARLLLSGVDCGGAVNLHDTRVDGDVLAASTPTHATRVTHVDASSLKVNGDFVFRTVQFACADATLPCLNLSFAEIKGNCFLPGGDGSNVRNLRLLHAKLGEAHFILDSNTTVAADGFSFRQLNVPGSDYCRFLEATAPFQRSTYQTVERYLRERGDDRNADLVYREMMRRDRRQECPQWLVALDLLAFWGDFTAHRKRRADARKQQEQQERETKAPKTMQQSKFWLWKVLFFPWPLLRLLVSSVFQFVVWLGEVFLDITTGRGTSSARMGWVLVAVFAFMWCMFLDPESVKREYNPTAAEVNDKADLLDLDKHPTDANKEWGTTEAAFAALRTVIPLMGDLPHNEWQPSSKPAKVLNYELPCKYESAAGFVHALSYIALPLFLASLSGLLKKRGD